MMHGFKKSGLHGRPPVSVPPLGALALWLLVVFLFFPAPAVSETGGEALFFSANQDFKEGRFAMAAEKYQDLVNQGQAGGDVFYNLGCAFMEMDQPGRAIASFEKARVLMPRNKDLAFNLNLARQKQKDQAESGDGLSLLGWLDYFSPQEVFWVFAVANALLCLVLALRVWVRTEWSWYFTVALALVWFTVGFCGAAKWWRAAHDDRAVVVAKETIVRAGPDSQDTVLFKLHDGSAVSWERSEGDWSLVRFSQKKRGWTPSDHIEKIQPLYPE